jgi:hypothetical protein
MTHEAVNVSAGVVKEWYTNPALPTAPGLVTVYTPFAQTPVTVLPYSTAHLVDVIAGLVKSSENGYAAAAASVISAEIPTTSMARIIFLNIRASSDILLTTVNKHIIIINIKINNIRDIYKRLLNKLIISVLHRIQCSQSDKLEPSMKVLQAIFFFGLCSVAYSQTQEAYDQKDEAKSGILDPSRLKIAHSMSFGMASGTSMSGLQSQSLYSTMMQYQFAAPVTLNLNFDLPVYSSFNSSQNMTGENMQSLDYFRNMPFDVSMIWQPSDRFQMRFSLVKYSEPYGGYFSDGIMSMGRRPFFRPGGF